MAFPHTRRFFRKAVAATLPFAVAVTCAGVASAHPGSAENNSARGASVASGIDHGVAFTSQLVPHSARVVTTLDGGEFTLSRDAKTVVVTNRSGATVASLPMAVAVAGHDIALAPSIDATHRTLTLMPVDAVQTDLTHPSQNEILGAVGGGLIGGAIGGLLGFGILSLITAPIGLIAGAYLGFNWGASQRGPILGGR
jgi:hypothetical protein